MPLTAAFYTLGCRLNQTESSIMAKSLENIGYRISEDYRTANLCVINTCTVTNQSDSKCRKHIRSIQKNNADALIAVVGCFSQVSSQQIEDIGGVDIILGNEEKLNIASHIERFRENGERIIAVPPISKDPFQIETIGQVLSSTRANLKIQDGCDFVCSYCIIPAARGRSRPRTPENILEEATSLADQGVKEIILTGVNIGTYQYGEKGFMTILDDLETVSGIQRIRISSIEPTTIGVEIFDRMQNPSSKVTPHLHLPLQSGCDEILRRMRRKYEFREFQEYVSKASQVVPDICIGSDVIVGFPGETDAMFEETIRGLTELPVAYFHVFPFAVRKGTTAAKLPDQIDGNTITRRATVLRKLSDHKRNEFMAGQVGKTVDVLFESLKDGENWFGYSGNYIRVGVKSDQYLKNQIRKVRLLEVEKGVVMGEIVGSSIRHSREGGNDERGQSLRSVRGNGE